MLLQRVVHELFEWEAEAAGAELSSARNGLQPQVRLEGADGSRLYVSWAWGRGQPDYFIDRSPDSFFTDPPAAEWGASGDPLWRPLLGRTVAVGHQGAGWQVIEVRSGRRWPTAARSSATACSSSESRGSGPELLRQPCGTGRGPQTPNQPLHQTWATCSLFETHRPPRGRGC